jgi:hypothetical protein
MLKILKKIRLAALVALSLSLLAPVQPAMAQDAVRIGTSSLGSVFYTIAIGVSEIITKHGKLNATVEPLGGSSANIFGLGAKKIEFALTNAFAAFSGYHGTYTFKKPLDVKLVVQGQPSYRFLVVRKGAKIKSPKDLIGRTIIGKRRALPELELVMNAYIKVFGLPRKKIKIVATTTSPETYNALRAGSVDGAIVPFSRKSAAVQKPMRDGVIEFLYISKEKRDEMLKHLPKAMYAGTFEPGVYHNQKKPVYLFGMNTYFMTHSGVSADVVYKVTKAIVENTKELTTYHKALRLWTAKRTLENVALPFHPGAIRYFKEKGLWTAQHAAKQKELESR